MNNVESGDYQSDSLDKNIKLESQLIHPLCKGSRNIRRYRVSDLSKSIIFPYKIVADKAVLLTKEELSRNYPETWEYLLANRKTLEARERGKWKHDKWYALGRNQNLNQMEQIKILTPSIAEFSIFHPRYKRILLFCR